MRSCVLLAAAVALVASLPACDPDGPGARSDATLARVRRLSDLLALARVETEGPAPMKPTHARLRGTTLRTLFQHPDSSIVFDGVPIPPRTVLEFSIGVADAGWERGSDGVVFEIQVGVDGARQTVFEQLLTDPSGGFESQEVPLDAFTGRAVQLVLRTSKGPRADGNYDWAYWGDPRLRSKPDASERHAQPNVLLVSFDTLRADFVGAYGQRPSPTPRMDSLARRGTLFERTVAQSAWTLPSHFALLSGRFPDRRLLEYDLNPCAIDEKVAMLAEHFAARGYLTAAFTGGGYVSSSLGFGQGFQVFESHGSRLEENLPAVLSWLDQSSTGPFFLFVHFFNVHRPYTPPADFFARFVTRVPSACRGLEFSEADNQSGRSTRCLESAGGVDYLREIYAAEVAYADALFGELLDAMRRQGILDETVVAVVSDHGEELMERGRLDHVRTLYEEVVRVPLILAGPGIPRGLRVGETVQLMDLQPTLLELAGIAPPPDVDARSLRPLLACRTSGSPACVATSFLARVRGERAEPRLAFSATAFDRDLPGLTGESYDFKASVVNDGEKLIWLCGGVREAEEIYDLDVDPGETRPIPGEERVAGGLRETLRSWVGSLPRDRYCRAEELDPGTREQLRALGYLP
jgi:arylsulfatase A-like enzyme